MHPLNRYLQMYIGCGTNHGEFVGVNQDELFIKSPVANDVQVFKIETVGKSLFLHMRSVGDLTPEEIKTLIEKGVNIGRPKGYSFSSEAFLFLLNLNIDLFGLIESGYAKRIEIATLMP